MDVAGGRDLVGEGQVALEQRTDVAGPGIVGGDDHARDRLRAHAERGAHRLHDPRRLRRADRVGAC